MTSRREKLEAMLNDAPEDTFLRYGVAMEYAKEGKESEALQRFGELMKDETPYVPAFFMAAQQVASHDVAQARTYLREGIEEARKQGDSHAAGEMSEFLASLGVT